MHDSRGAALKVGDRVFLEAEVVNLSTGGDENFCCVDVQVKTPDQPGGEKVMAPPKINNMSTRMLTKIGAAALLALFAVFLMPARAGAEWRQVGDAWIAVPEVEPQPTAKPTAMVIPPGYHAHTTVDGRTIVHADSNFGKAAPHAGVAHPWPKTGYPGDTVIVDEPRAVIPIIDPASYTASVTPSVASASPPQSHVAAVTRTGPIRRIFGVIFHRAAERRAARHGGQVEYVDASSATPAVSATVATGGIVATAMQVCPGGKCPTGGMSFRIRR